MKTYVKIILGLVILVILALGAWFLYSFINNGQRNFYVTYGDRTITGSAENLELEKDKYTVIGCETLTGVAVDYTVTVIPNADKLPDFDFTYNGGKVNFKRNFSGYDCGALFRVEKHEKYFTLVVPGEITFEEIIRQKYPEGELSDIPEFDFKAQDSFIITVIDSAEHTTTQIYFH